MDTVITSAQNPKVKEAKKLWKRRERDQSGRFLIEGYRELLRATEAHWEMERCFFSKELFLGENEEALLDELKARGCHLFPCSEAIFRSLSYRDRPDGLLGVAVQKHLFLDQLSLSETPFLVVAEAIEKPGNLGTILRSCDATNVDALIVCDQCTDIFNPNVVRASVGTLFTRPVIECSSIEAIEWLKKENVQIVSATPRAETFYTEANLTKGSAIVVGTEQYGLQDVWFEKSDSLVKLPMLGEADSLNVAMATTALLYETLRQRRH